MHGHTDGIDERDTKMKKKYRIKITGNEAYLEND